MSNLNHEIVRERIRQVALLEAGLSETSAADAAFHMTDWLGELEAFQQFCSNPNALSDTEVNELLIQFLVHVPNHLAAAGKLYINVPVTDIFGVGATREEDDAA